MFFLEPMIAKMLLPTLGGAPMVWNTCVAFFQIMLLAGYAYAHGATSWFGSGRRALAYAALLVLPFATLPLAMRAASAPPVTGNPVGWLLVVLLSSIGLPFLALAASSSALQQLFSETRHRASRDPYFLYAASNLGSLLALVAYPSLIEPSIRVADQRRFWTLGYGAFAALALTCAFLAWRRIGTLRGGETPAVERANLAAPRPTASRRARWVLLAFIPSSAMLGATSYLSAEIASVPLLWIVPLSLYLVTFVLAFSRWAERCRAIANRLLPLLIMPLVLFMTAQSWVVVGFAIVLNLLTFVAVALLCHCTLANDRPPPASLTEFYFWIAFGGMLGGLFNTLVAPVLFSSTAEYPLVLVLACLMRSEAMRGTARPRYSLKPLIVPAVVGALTIGLIVGTRRFGEQPSLIIAVLALPVMLTFSRSRKPVEFALSVGAMLLAGAAVGNASGVLHTERTFFGVYRVTIDPAGRYHSLFHGTTLHGMQAVSDNPQPEPLTYYHRTGPFGQAFDTLPQVSMASEIAVVGLGVGALASYALPHQRWTFYEIDPAIERIARDPDYFRFLSRCGDRCQVVLGDARLSLARAQRGEYGLIALDAFSSDAIPMHLMTSEAIALYLTRLGPHGVLAFHISNRHLSLGPVLARLALAHGLVAIEQKQGVTATDAALGKSASDWLVMARDRADLEPLAGDARWAAPRISPAVGLWTDDFSNILSVFRLW